MTALVNAGFLAQYAVSFLSILSNDAACFSDPSLSAVSVLCHGLQNHKKSGELGARPEPFIHPDPEHPAAQLLFDQARHPGHGSS
jgi:hypothetical protein